MHLANELLHELEAPGLSLNERALLRCRLAKHLEQGGDYNGARLALFEFWEGMGKRPNLSGLDAHTQAHVLLRVGSLTGWIGSADQIEGSQGTAKDLISESARAFQVLRLRANAGEARSDLALCYWREGAFDEARITLKEALTELGEGDIEQRAVILLRKGIIERASGQLNEALRVCSEAAPLFDQIADDLLTAHFHHAFANALKDVTENEKREDYADRAFMEYTAASYHFEQAGHERFQACVENNIGSLLGIIGKYDEAHEHLDRATALITRLKDNARLGQFDETRARVFLAEGRNIEAEKAARVAVALLEKGDKSSWLAETLITHGIALSRLSHPEQARASFEQALNVAEQAGDLESAGLAALSLVEHADLSHEETRSIIEHARSLLNTTENIETIRRLAKVAFQILFEGNLAETPPDWTNFSLRRAVQKYESNLIRAALNEAGGAVTKAAHLLGLKHHQSLASIIEARHPELTDTRKPKRPRRKHLFSPPRRLKKKY